jgi:hypothetical protein
MLGEIEISPFFYIFGFMNGIFKDTEIDLRFRRLKELTTLKLWFDSLDERVQEFIIHLVQNSQLYSRGIDEFGEVIGRYSQLTEEINPDKIAGTPYTFKDTGEFFKSFVVTPLSEGFLIDADDLKYSYERSGDSIVPKVTFLFVEYGDRIIGLTDESKEELRKMMLIKFIENVKKVL